MRIRNPKWRSEIPIEIRNSTWFDLTTLACDMIWHFCDHMRYDVESISWHRIVANEFRVLLHTFKSLGVRSHVGRDFKTSAHSNLKDSLRYTSFISTWNCEVSHLRRNTNASWSSSWLSPCWCRWSFDGSGVLHSLFFIFTELEPSCRMGRPMTSCWICVTFAQALFCYRNSVSCNSGEHPERVLNLNQDSHQLETAERSDKWCLLWHFNPKSNKP
jgi:hypothetical protein